MQEDAVGIGGSPPRWLGLVSGGIAGATGVLVGHAFDTMKVQAQLGGASPAAAPSTAPLPQRILALYRGILPPLLTTGAVRAVYFAIFENVKLGLGAPPGDTAPLQTVLLAAGVTGCSVAPLTQPFVALKIWQQANGGTLAAASAAMWSRGRVFHGFGLHAGLETAGLTVRPAELGAASLHRRLAVSR